MNGKNRLGFRGESRPPELIFKIGLNSKDTEALLEYDGGLRDKTGVCVSWRISAASYFPLPLYDKNRNARHNSYSEDTWIYVVNIDVSKANTDNIFQSAVDVKMGKNTSVMNKSKSHFFNTHGRQTLDVLDAKAEANSFFGEQELLFADEVAVKEIHPKDVLFAIPCKRVFNNPNFWRSGGHYTLGKVIENPNKRSTIPEKLISEMRKFLDAEITSPDNKLGFEMPLPVSGYEKRSVKK